MGNYWKSIEASAFVFYRIVGGFSDPQSFPVISNDA